jgi:murein DD-endopeptidase MepM/ murein hydrolase activator NlpD
MLHKRFMIPAILLLIGLVLPNHWQIPVNGASSKDWHPKTFWYEPWGTSVTHKGIDIFGATATPVVAANHGLLLYKGEFKKGGKVLVYLGPEWKIHYYAHLADFTPSTPIVVASGETIAYLGDSGNAKGKPPHLHFSIFSLLPYFWNIDGSTQGWKKMFYLDPNDYLREPRQ